MVEAVLRVKNWREFQHYTNRSPPWIKLHTSLLDDYEFQSLPIASRALAPMLWLLASSNMDGTIPADLDKLAFRFRWSVKELKAGLTPLIEKGFIEPASNTLAECKQDACLETETETETDGASAPVVPGLDKKAWDTWIQYRIDIRKPLNPKTYEVAMRKLASHGAGQMAAVENSMANNYRGLFAPDGNARPKAAKPDPYRNAL